MGEARYLLKGLTGLGWAVGGKKCPRVEHPGAGNPVNPPSPHPGLLRAGPARQKGVGHEEKGAELGEGRFPCQEIPHLFSLSSGLLWVLTLFLETPGPEEGVAEAGGRPCPRVTGEKGEQTSNDLGS